MGQLKLFITFRGGKADEHRMSTDTLARVFQSISSDIENVYRVVSHADIDITSADIKKDSKLYYPEFYLPKVYQVMHFFFSKVYHDFYLGAQVQEHSAIPLMLPFHPSLIFQGCARNISMMLHRGQLHYFRRAHGTHTKPRFHFWNSCILILLIEYFQ